VPEIIGLRRRLVGDERGRYHLLGCSVLEDAWLKAVRVHSRRPCLFLAETVFVYFTEVQVRRLVLTLREHFPGAELVFDGWKPFEIWLGNIHLSPSKFAGLMRWGLWRGLDIEGWGDGAPVPHGAQRSAGISLLDEWGFFDQPEPRMDAFRWMAGIFRLFKPICIYHYQLGEAQV
jgi:O-methyltransferase involved in polyketide biosynthesis